MSDHVQQTIRMLEQEIESHHQSVAELERALIPLRRITGLNEDPPLARGKKRTAKVKTPRRAKVKPPKDRRARPVAGETIGNGNDRILEALARRSPMKPRELALATSLTLYTLRQYLKPLVKSGRVEVTGATMSRQVRLAGNNRRRRRPEPAPSPEPRAHSPEPATRATRMTSEQLGVQPASPEAVAARDAAILQALKLRPWKTEALLSVMPEETTLTPPQRQAALSSALIRLRVRGHIKSVDGVWALA